MKTLVPVLGDQLSATISSLQGATHADTIVLMMEVAEETTYVRHHKQKLVYILSAMRHHAAYLRELGWTVDYVTLDDADNTGSFSGEVARAVERHEPDRIVVTEAGEWRVQAMLEAWPDRFACAIEIRPDRRFVASHAEFDGWADGRKGLTMEYFYRDMRRKTGLLMDGENPCEGRWNFDKENRKPAKADLLMPRPLRFDPDETTRAVIAMIEARFPDNPGTLDGFAWGVSREDAQRQADEFFKHALADFGPYEDAMLTGEHHLWHSILSPYLNSGLLDPTDLCQRAEQAYRDGKAPINSVEGYIRQIIGWREFMRGDLLARRPRLRDAQLSRAQSGAPRFLLDGQDRHALSGAGDRTDARHRARASYPAFDGDGQFRVIDRCGPGGGPSLVSRNLYRRV